MIDQDYDRQPPQDLDAERSALGAMLLSSRALQDVSDVLSAEHFYAPKHGAIFTAMQQLTAQGDAVDAVTLVDKLIRDGLIDRVGGAPYVHTLIDTVPVATNAEFYAEIVLDKHQQRRVIEAGTRIAQLGWNGGDDMDEVIDRARATIDEVASEGRSTVAELSFEDTMMAYIEESESPLDPAISTGISELDDILGGGLRAGQLIVLGARPGIGKSVLGVNIATAAATAGHGVFFASLEMSKRDCMDRVFSSVGSIPMGNLVQRSLTSEDRRRRALVQTQAAQWALKIDDNPHQTVNSIRSKARDLTRTKRGVGLVVVDYLQLMGNTKKHDRRDLEIGENTRGLKLLAKELGIAIVALCQVGRGAEARTDKRPTKADLRESGSIENDADTVILLHRDLVDQERMDYVEAIVAKQRSGPTGTLDLFWSGSYQRITGQGRSHLAVV